MTRFPRTKTEERIADYQKSRHVELFGSLHVLWLVFLDVFYGDRERDRYVRFPHFPTGNSKNAFFVLFANLPLTEELRDTTVAFESDSFLEVLLWSLFERSMRTAVLCTA